MRKIIKLLIIAVLFIEVSYQSWATDTKTIKGKITKIVDISVTKEGKEVIYTGRLLWAKNDQPAILRVMLVSAESDLYDETITNRDGYYRLVGPRDDLLIMVQPTHTRKRPVPKKKLKGI